MNETCAISLVYLFERFRGKIKIRILNPYWLQWIQGCFLLWQRFRKFRSEVRQTERSFSLPSNRNIREHLWRWSGGGGPKIAVPFWPTGSFPYFSSLMQGIRKRNKNVENYFSWLARFHWKMLFFFPRVIPRVSDRSLRHNGAPQEIMSKSGSF